MSDYIMVACDLHDKTIVLRLARGTERPSQRVFRNDAVGRAGMQRELLARSRSAGGARIVFAYEASSQGFGLYDQLTDAGILCYVLAPTHLPRSARSARRKTDARDALILLDLLRGHLLAGNELPTVWVPDRATRDDRELLRSRLDAAEKLAALKAQVQSLLKRQGLRWLGKSQPWSIPHRCWLTDLAEGRCVPAAAGPVNWGPGGAAALGSLFRQIKNIEKEIETLDAGVALLAGQGRYGERVRRLRTRKGVGLLTAMVFLTEVGDLSRFRNRRQIAAYLGLVPSSHESGERSDRKGHIIRQGPSRVRKVLCQALWSAIRTDPAVRCWYERQVDRHPKAKKIAVVAGMRRLAIAMWRRGLEGPPPAPMKRPTKQNPGAKRSRAA